MDRRKFMLTTAGLGAAGHVAADPTLVPHIRTHWVDAPDHDAVVLMTDDVIPPHLPAFRGVGLARIHNWRDYPPARLAAAKRAAEAAVRNFLHAADQLGIPLEQVVFQTRFVF